MERIIIEKLPVLKKGASVRDNQKRCQKKSKIELKHLRSQTTEVSPNHGLPTKAGRRAWRAGWLAICAQLGAFCLTLGFSIQQVWAKSAPDPQNVTVLSQKGAVAADHPLASAVGASILDQGGSAADAAVATLLTLGVVNPFASGLGGGGFCLAWNPNKPEIAEALDFRETAPLKASKGMYLVNGKADSKLSRTGGLAVAVPGEAAGLEALHKRYGKLPWKNVVQPAYEIAHHGFFVGKLLPKRLASKDKRMPQDSLLRAAFTSKKSSKFPTPYSWFQRQELATTLAILRDKGAKKGFYQGPVAQAMVKQVQATGGILSMRDLARYSPTWRLPIQATYRDKYTLYSMPTPSSGGIVLAQVLNVLEEFDLAKMGWGPQAVHLVIEALKHAFADRAKFLGDSDFVKVPVSTLTSKAYAEKIKARINPDATLPQEAYGNALPPKDDDGTTHISVVDEQGQMIACTSTINTSFGSMVYVPKFGLIMNNEMDDFSAQPGVPNAFGLVGNAQNAIAPNKRPLSSMSPTLILKDKQPHMIVGASGGPTIITGTLFALLRVLDFGFSATDAILSNRLHHQWLPHRIYYEGQATDELAKGLVKRGHDIAYRPAFNSVQLLLRTSPSQWVGVSDPRKEGRPAAQTRSLVKD